MKNHDPHKKAQKGLVPVTTQREEVMWDEQSTAVGGQRKKKTSNTIFAKIKDKYIIAGVFTNSEEEPEIMATHQDGAGPSGTRSGKPYLKDYTRVDLKNIYGELAKTVKQKGLRCQKNPARDEAKEAAFKFDIIAQLANIPARVTLYELLRLLKSTREAIERF